MRRLSYSRLGNLAKATNALSSAAGIGTRHLAPRRNDLFVRERHMGRLLFQAQEEGQGATFIQKWKVAGDHGHVGRETGGEQGENREGSCEPENRPGVGEG